MRVGCVLVLKLTHIVEMGCVLVLKQTHIVEMGCVLVLKLTHRVEIGVCFSTKTDTYSWDRVCFSTKTDTYSWDWVHYMNKLTHFKIPKGIPKYFFFLVTAIWIINLGFLPSGPYGGSWGCGSLFDPLVAFLWFLGFSSFWLLGIFHFLKGLTHIVEMGCILVHEQTHIVRDGVHYSTWTDTSSLGWGAL